MFPAVHGIVSQGAAGRGDVGSEATLLTADPTLSFTLGSTNQAGWAFSPTAAMRFNAFRIKTGAVGQSAIARLWEGSPIATPQTVLASKAFTTATSWTRINLDSPVDLTAGKTYTITIRHASGGTLTFNFWSNGANTFGGLTSDDVTYIGQVASSTDAFPGGTTHVYGWVDGYYQLL